MRAAVSAPTTNRVPGNSLDFSTKVGARVTQTAARHANWRRRWQTSALRSGGLSTLATHSSNTAGALIRRAAAAAKPQWPAWTGLKEPATNAGGDGPPVRCRPSGSTQTQSLPPRHKARSPAVGRGGPGLAAADADSSFKGFEEFSMATG